MIDYELAKKLKDAGFPQHGRGQWVDEDQDPSDHEHGLPEYPEYYVPTLSELIEACGERFSCVHRKTDGTWVAGLINADDKYICGEGPTPDAAVARLWLTRHANGGASA